MVYLYCRISQRKQHIERQKRNLLSAYPNGLIVEEAYTGTETASRPEWAKLFKRVNSGDTIVFDSVSRMSRNAEEGITAYEALYNRGVNLVFLKEPYINTDKYRDLLAETKIMPRRGDEIDYIMEGIEKFLIAYRQKDFFIAFQQSEKEVLDLRQRTKEGLETARLNGKRIGTQKGDHWETKKAKEAKKKMLQLSREFGGTNTDAEVMKICGISERAYYKYKAQLKADRIARVEAETRAILESD